VTDYSRDLLFLLNDVGRLLRTDADRRARFHGMTRAQWGILVWLERRGMVVRRADENDRRIWRLHLTSAATPVLQEIHEYRIALTASLTDDMSPSARAHLIQSLVHIKCLLTTDRPNKIKEVA
jgi:MarR family transcriptional regulator for hemolysin